jgi:hypothetical protein
MSKDFRHAPLIEGVNSNPLSDERGDDVPSLYP